MNVLFDPRAGQTNRTPCGLLNDNRAGLCAQFNVANLKVIYWNQSWNRSTCAITAMRALTTTFCSVSKTQTKKRMPFDECLRLMHLAAYRHQWALSRHLLTLLGKHGKMRMTCFGGCCTTWLQLLVVIILPGVFSFNLTILHTNDIHNHFDEVTSRGFLCHSEENMTCFGGVARWSTAIKNTRAKYENVLLLDAGDQYQGSVWFSVYRGNASLHYMNMLRYDAMTFGNHEFDTGIQGIVPFLLNATFPIVCSNIDATDEPTLNGLFNKSIVLNVGGTQVGIVGYITTETNILSGGAGRLRFLDEVSSVQAEVDKLTNAGVKIIIALGHAGIAKDREIASSVRNIDIVVGGHSHTFLYTGKAPSSEKPEDVYPTVVTQSSSNRVLIVEAFEYGKYLGFLQVTFDDQGNLTNWSGNPILMDMQIERDPLVVEDVRIWRVPLDLLSSQVVGSTLTVLDGESISCRLRECTMGNVVTESFVNYFRQHVSGIQNVNIAIANGGSIRSSIDEGNVTNAELLTTLPYGDTVDIVELLGADVFRVLERSVENYDPCNRHGKFLQMSGLHVVYNLNRPNGQRVQQVTVLDSQGHYVPLTNDTAYNISVPKYLYEGGDGYSMIKEKMLRHFEYGALDVDVLRTYISQNSPLNVTIEGRIQFDPAAPVGCSPAVNETLTTAAPSIANTSSRDLPAILLIVSVFLAKLL